MKHVQLAVLDARPPNYERILAMSPSAATPGVIFAYAPHVYMPGAAALKTTVLSRELSAHEAVHLARQGAEPGYWWEKYIADPAFRFVEELVAHQAEYAEYKKRFLDPGKRHRALLHVASRLAGGLYGNLAKRDTAVKMILTYKEAEAA